MQQTLKHIIVVHRFDTWGVEGLVEGLTDGGWRGSSANYSTSVMGNVSAAWIRKVVAEDPDRPFYAHIGPKAPHEPQARLNIVYIVCVCVCVSVSVCLSVCASVSVHLRS